MNSRWTWCWTVKIQHQNESTSRVERFPVPVVPTRRANLSLPSTFAPNFDGGGGGNEVHQNMARRALYTVQRRAPFSLVLKGSPSLAEPLGAALWAQWSYGFPTVPAQHGL